MTVVQKPLNLHALCLAANVLRKAPRRQITTDPRPPVLKELLAFCHQPWLHSKHFRSVANPAAWIRDPSRTIQVPETRFPVCWFQRAPAITVLAPCWAGRSLSGAGLHLPRTQSEAGGGVLQSHRICSVLPIKSGPAERYEASGCSRAHDPEILIAPNQPEVIPNESGLPDAASKQFQPRSERICTRGGIVLLFAIAGQGALPWSAWW